MLAVGRYNGKVKKKRKTKLIIPPLNLRINADAIKREITYGDFVRGGGPGGVSSFFGNSLTPSRKQVYWGLDIVQVA